MKQLKWNMANSDSMIDGPPTKKAKIGGDANGKRLKFTFNSPSVIILFVYIESVTTLMTDDLHG